MGIFQLNNGVNVHSAALNFEDPVIAAGRHTLSVGTWVAVAVGIATIVSAMALLSLLVRHRRQRRQASRFAKMTVVTEGTSLLAQQEEADLKFEKLSMLDLQEMDKPRVIVDHAVPSLMASEEGCQSRLMQFENTELEEVEVLDEQDFLWNQALIPAASQDVSLTGEATVPIVAIQPDRLEGELGHFV